MDGTETIIQTIGLKKIYGEGDSQVIALDGIVFGGAGTNRTVTLRPLTNAFGPVDVTITLTDAEGGVTSGLLQVDVTPVNDAPVLLKFSIGEFRQLVSGFGAVRIVPERFPVKSRKTCNEQDTHTTSRHHSR